MPLVDSSHFVYSTSVRFQIVFNLTLLFIVSTKAVNINCKFNHLAANIFSGNFVGGSKSCDLNCYQCTVQKLIITKPNQTVSAINGNHQDEDIVDVYEVVILKIFDQIVNYFPSRFDDHFPFLTSLKIWSSGLRSFKQADIKEFKYLSDLSLTGNLLETLDSNVFQFNIRLMKIDFTRNRLKHVGLNLLRPLKNLIFADFYQNDCISDGARYSFGDLKTNLRENCKPTREMLLLDIESLSNEVEALEREVEHREKKIFVCEEAKDTHAKLDSLFPLILNDDLNLRALF